MAAPAVPVVDGVRDTDAIGTVALYSIPETAKRLSCSISHVYRLIDADVLRGVDISQPGSAKSKLRVRSDDLAELIEGQP